MHIIQVDWEEYDPPLHREEWGRIVRYEYGSSTMFLCELKFLPLQEHFNASSVSFPYVSFTFDRFCL